MSERHAVVVVHPHEALVLVPAGADLTTLVPSEPDEALAGRIRAAYADVWARRLGLDPAVALAAVTEAAVAGHVVQVLAFEEIIRETAGGGGVYSRAIPRHLRALVALAR